MLIDLSLRCSLTWASHIVGEPRSADPAVLFGQPLDGLDALLYVARTAIRASIQFMHSTYEYSTCEYSTRRQQKSLHGCFTITRMPLLCSKFRCQVVYKLNSGSAQSAPGWSWCLAPSGAHCHPSEYSTFGNEITTQMLYYYLCATIV